MEEGTVGARACTLSSVKMPQSLLIKDFRYLSVDQCREEDRNAILLVLFGKGLFCICYVGYHIIICLRPEPQGISGCSTKKTLSKEKAGLILGTTAAEHVHYIQFSISFFVLKGNSLENTLSLMVLQGRSFKRALCVVQISDFSGRSQKLGVPP
jgi:hypothetical protein